MADELEPIAGDVVEPTAVIGPDDWRPYTAIDLRAVVDHIVYRWAQEERAKAYDPFGAAEYSDPQNVRERGKPTGGYDHTDALRYGAQFELQRRMRIRHAATSMELMDPKAIIRITGTGM